MRARDHSDRGGYGFGGLGGEFFGAVFGIEFGGSGGRGSFGVDVFVGGRFGFSFGFVVGALFDGRFAFGLLRFFVLRRRFGGLRLSRFGFAAAFAFGTIGGGMSIGCAVSTAGFAAAAAFASTARSVVRSRCRVNFGVIFHFLGGYCR